MNIEIEFNYQGQITIIQCNTQDNLNNIFHIFINKSNIDINLIYFLYSGNIIEGNSIIEKIINSTDKERKKMNILVNNKDDIYIYFHDEDEIQSDLFYTFEALMKKGMTNLFDPHFLQKDEPGYKLYEIFPQMWKDDSNENKPTYVYRRSSLLIKEKLKSLDNDLYTHFKKIGPKFG